MKALIIFTLISTTIVMAQQKPTSLSLLKEEIKEKNTQELINIISKNPELLEKEDENKNSGFMLIAYSNHPDAFKKAISLKQSFNFHEAIISGKSEIVKSYIEKNKKKINEYSNDGFTPIALASFFDQKEIATYLLNQGADPGLNAKNPSKVNALHAAVAKENIALCTLLIEHGVDINRAQTQNVTPLHSAVHRGNLELVKLLVDNGADIILKMDNGDDALTIAKRDQHTKVIDFLMNVRK